MSVRRFVVALILHDISASIRDTRTSTKLWLGLGGGALAAYAIGILIVGTRFRADMLREAAWVWSAAVPATMLLSGAGMGWYLGRVAIERAHAPFLKAQPLGDAARRKAAALAAHVLGAPLTVLDGGVVLLLALLVDRPGAVAWWLGATALSALGFAVALHLRLRRPRAGDDLPDQSVTRPGIPAKAGITSGATGVEPSRLIALLDRRRPSWLGAWAWRLPAGRLRLTAGRLAFAAILAVVGLGAVIASFVRHTATAGVMAGVFGGLGLFILTARFQPLLSPVLRASALRFGRAWLALMRLPLAISAGFFALTALPATAAEPSAWQAPVAGAMGLLLLNAIYAVFAAFFAASPKLAVFAFGAAMALTAYESLEYSSTVFLGLGVLLIFLWMRTRRSYRHG